MARCRLVALLAVAAAGSLCGPALAHQGEAGSSPAPDLLAAEPVYYPAESVSPAVALRLDAVVDAVRGRGLDVKVALIAGEEDLGDLTDFFGRPQEYAAFLASQLPGASDRTPVRRPLLVVMPSGFGFDHFPPAGERAVHGLELSVDARPDDVAQAAGRALQRAARATGRPVAPRFADAFGRGPRLRSSDAGLLGGLLGVSALGVAAGLRARRRGAGLRA